MAGAGLPVTAEGRVGFSPSSIRSRPGPLQAGSRSRARLLHGRHGRKKLDCPQRRPNCPEPALAGTGALGLVVGRVSGKSLSAQIGCPPRPWWLRPRRIESCVCVSVARGRGQKAVPGTPGRRAVPRPETLHDHVGLAETGNRTANHEAGAAPSALGMCVFPGRFCGGCGASCPRSVVDDRHGDAVPG